MVCPFRVNKRISVDDGTFHRETTVEEIYPECMGNKCPYYRKSGKSLILIEKCRRAINYETNY